MASSFSSKGLGSIAKTCGMFGVRVKCPYFKWPLEAFKTPGGGAFWDHQKMKLGTIPSMEKGDHLLVFGAMRCNMFNSIHSMIIRHLGDLEQGPC